MIYVASPYTGNDAEMAYRARKVSEFTAEMMAEGHIVFSPISYGHTLAQIKNLPKAYDYWLKFNLEILQICTELWVLKLEGWEKSNGIKVEIQVAMDLGISIKYFSVEENENERRTS